MKDGWEMRRVMISAAAGLLLAVALWLFFRFILHPSSFILPQSDPRLEYAGPFRNVDPAVRYVPDDRCAGCHADVARSFAEHPMGRSLRPVAQVAAPPSDARHNNPFEALGSQFQVEREGGRVRHRRARFDAHGRQAAELEWEVRYALGSGAHGYAYLTDRDGYLFETPISWYSQKQGWDLSPGFRQVHLTGRAVLPDCLFCHANRANHLEGSVNRYTAPVFDGYAIGCQRCHGPGELHVVSRDRSEPVPDEVDYTIVNPRHLEPSLREAVCEQCHLLGVARVLRRGRGLYDFRPGLPPALFWSEFVSAGEAKAVGHVEQMYQSRCFQGSAGNARLGCVSCHDPHERVPTTHRVAYYRGRCLHCHQVLASGEVVSRGAVKNATHHSPLTTHHSPEDDCIACHMPRYGSSDIPHTASTDHRILRGSKEASQRDVRPARRDGFPMVSFYSGPGKGDGEAERDRAVAVVNLALEGDASLAAFLGQALAGLDAALQRDPADVAAGEARGYSLALERRWAEALPAFRAVLAQAPDRELVLRGAAAAAEELRETEAAVGYWRGAIGVNSWEPAYHRRLALLLVKKEAWAEAEPVCKAWVALDPMNTEARAMLVSCLLAAGNKDGARNEFARIEALAPANLLELRFRFEKKLR